MTARLIPDSAEPRRRPRDRAARVLTLCYDGWPLCHDVLEDLQRRAPLLPLDAALAAELVIGVMRHRLTAEHLVAKFYRGRWGGLRPHLRIILAVAAYQLCWLDRIPEHAAVDQAVRQAKLHGTSAASMVNAVLRKLAKCRGRVIEQPVDPEPRRYLKIDPHRGRLFDEDVFPDPAKRPLDYLIAVTSHPAWLVERWHRRFKPKLCRQVCDAGQRRPPLVLRPNPLRTTAAQLMQRLDAAGLQPRRQRDSDAIILPDAPPASQVPEVEAGKCQPQDSTSQIALRLAPPKPGEFVLDLCAGVGTKSTQAAELMNNQGVVIATDIDARKLEKIPDNARRLGIAIIASTPMDDLDARLARLGSPPDLILIDVPCTNTGVLARRPEARYRASRKTLLELVDIQKRIIRRALDLAGPRTRLLYTTCSLEQEENEAQIDYLREIAPALHVQRQVFTLPDADRDGGFAAVLTQAP
ncbi:MAG: transcription antitermination factor NusB [Planctomycetota bacterium]